MLAKPLEFPGNTRIPGAEFRVDVNTDDEASIVRGLNAVRYFNANKGRCWDCFVRPGIVHLPECPLAPPDLIELCRAEMYAALLPAHP